MTWQTGDITLEHNSVTASCYARLVMGRFVRRHCLWLALPALVCCLLAALRWEWLVVALIWVMVAVPMLMPLVYFNYMLTPETRWSLLPKSVQIGERGIALEFDDDVFPGSVTLAWDDVQSCEQRGSLLVFELKVRHLQFLLIDTAPAAVEDDEAEA